MLLIAKACGGILKDHETFAQVIEMTYFGSVLHSNLRENEDLNESKIFGEKGKILGGDFMISNAAILCCTVDNLRLIQLLCVIVQNFSRSNFSGTPESDPRSSFLRRIYLKDVSMLAYACQGIALLSNSDEDAAFAYGAHFALAHKLVNDIKASRLNKENKDNKDKTQQSPLFFPAFFGESVDQSMLKSEQLAKLHIEAAFNLSSKFQNSSDLELWASSLQVKLSY
jgi:geranylgeranyl pyrophosphate synthase